MTGINFDPITAKEVEMGSRPRVPPTAAPELETPPIYVYDPTSPKENNETFFIRPLTGRADAATLETGQYEDFVAKVVFAAKLDELPPHNRAIVRLRYEHIEGRHPVEVIVRTIDQAMRGPGYRVFHAPLVIDMVGLEAHHAYAVYAEIANEFKRCMVVPTEGVYVYINGNLYADDLSRRVSEAARVYHSMSSNHRWVDEISGSLLSRTCVVRLIDDLIGDRITLEQKVNCMALQIEALEANQKSPPQSVGVIETDALSPEEDAALVAELEAMGREMDERELRFRTADETTNDESDEDAPFDGSDEDVPFEVPRMPLIQTEDQLAAALAEVEKLRQDNQTLNELTAGLRDRLRRLEDSTRIGTETSGG